MFFPLIFERLWDKGLSVRLTFSLTKNIFNDYLQ